MSAGTTFTVAAPVGHAAFRRTDGTPIKVLVVDDERVVAEMVSMTLRCDGADTITASDAAAAMSAARRDRPDVAIVDPRLPDMDGMQFVHALHEQHPGLLLLLTSPNSEPDRVARVSVGQDWLAKPFSIEEMLRRVRTMIRRAAITLPHISAEIVVGDLALNEDSREATRAGEEIHLSYTEFELLRFFVRNPQRVLTKQQIVGRVWPYDFAGRSTVVELYVSYLRKKIDAGRAPMIHTLRRTGYILKPAVSSPVSVRVHGGAG